jgi:hypothetical protein
MGRQAKTCDLPHLSADAVEEAITREYLWLRLPKGFAAHVDQTLTTTMRDEKRLALDHRKTLTAQLAKLDVAQERLVDLAVDGTLPRETIQQRLNKIVRERQKVQEALASANGDLEHGAQVVRLAVDLLDDTHRLYQRAPNDVRRLMNQAFYERLYVDSPAQVIDVVLKPPFDDLERAAALFRPNSRKQVVPEFGAARGPRTARQAPRVSLAAVSSTAAVVELAVRYSNHSDLCQTLVDLHKRLESMPKRIAQIHKPPHVNKLSRRLDPMTVELIIAGYQAGTPSTVLAQQFGIAKSSILRLLHQHGLAKRRRRGMTARQEAKAITLYEQGWSAAKIAEQLQLDDSTVHRRLKGAGVVMRDTQGRIKRQTTSGPQPRSTSGIMDLDGTPPPGSITWRP